MANVTCPNCGMEFESRARKCPSCGAKNRLMTCRVCGAQMAKGAKHCPKCGAKNRRPIYKHWWFWVLLFCVLFFIPAKPSDSQEDPPTESSDSSSTVAVDEPETLELVGGMDATQGTYDEDLSCIHITGQVKNIGDRLLDYTEITFSLYDEAGNLLGTAMDNVVNLRPGETWNFDALGFSDVSVDSFRLSELTGTSYGS